MKKKFNTIIDSLKDSQIEKFSFIILMLWAISPLIEYIFKNYFKFLYTHYFTYTIYVIGFSGIITYILYFIKLKKRNYKLFIPEILLLCLLIVSVISTFLSNNPHLSFFGESYRREGLFIYIMYLGFILLASTIKNHKYIGYLFQTILISCLIITIHPLFKSNFSFINFHNIFHNLNHYAYYLMINIMISIFMFINSNTHSKEIIYLLSYIFLLSILIINNTFGSYLAIIITIIMLFIYSMIKKYNRLKIIIVILIFILTSIFVSNLNIETGEKHNIENTKGIISNNIASLNNDLKGFIDNNEETINNAGSSRGFLWKEAWRYTLKHPLIGGGMESLSTYYIEDKGIYYNSYNDRPHNSLLEVSSFIGIPGAIIYLTLIIYLAITNLKIITNDIEVMIYFTAACYFISSQFGNSMYYTSPYFMILLGLLIGFNRYNKAKLKRQ